MLIRTPLDEGPRSKIQQNWIFLLVESFKLVPRSLDKGPRTDKSNCDLAYMASFLSENQTKERT
jgi:hypothetical protein